LSIWRCNEKYEHEKPCQTPHLTEDEIKQKFLVALNALMGGRDELIANCRLAQIVLCDCDQVDTELDELHREIKVVTELSRKAIHDNARVVQSQDEFNERNNGYLDRYRKAMDRVSELEDKKRARKTKNLILDAFIREIESRPPGH
jgi:site-specific DNA recombinase